MAEYPPVVEGIREEKSTDRLINNIRQDRAYEQNPDIYQVSDMLQESTTVTPFLRWQTNRSSGYFPIGYFSYFSSAAFREKNLQQHDGTQRQSSMSKDKHSSPR